MTSNVSTFFILQVNKQHKCLDVILRKVAFFAAPKWQKVSYWRFKETFNWSGLRRINKYNQDVYIWFLNISSNLLMTHSKKL